MKSLYLLASGLVISLAPTSIFANLTPPFTQATAYAEASSGSQGPGLTIDPNSASDFKSDISNFSEYLYGSANATASLFVNGVADSGFVFGPNRYFPPTQPTDAHAFYQLGWADGTTFGSIFPEADVFQTGDRTAAFQFTYGTDYTLTSLLKGDAQASILSRGFAWSSSTWAETFTFLGQPDGTLGTATFEIDFSGSSVTKTNIYAERFDISSAVSVSASLGVGNLPPGTWIQTASGTAVPGLPDRGSTLLMTGAAVAMLAAQRRVKR